MSTGLNGTRCYESTSRDTSRQREHPRILHGDQRYIERCVDETYVKVAGRWHCLYRAVDQHGQIIGVLLWQRRDGAAARALFTRPLRFGPRTVRGED
jgi:transposase-like protein